MYSLTDADFRRIEQTLQNFVRSQDFDAADRYFATEITNSAQGRAYSRWKLQELSNTRDKMVIPSAAEYIAKIKDTKYTNDDEVAQLTELLSLPAFPYIGLGVHKGCGFRLAPNPRLLAPTTADSDHEQTQRDVLPHIMLGVNKNVEPLPTDQQKRKRTRKENNSDESNESTDSTSNNDETGFVFYQLGRLEYVSADQWDPTIQDPNSLFWQDSGYVVVVLIDSNGNGADTYLLYNFRPLEDGTRHQVDDSEWGWLPGDTIRRAGIKIAAKISDLRHGYPISLPDPAGDKNIEPTWMKKNFQLVQAFKEGFPAKIVREFIVASREGDGR